MEPQGVERLPLIISDAPLVQLDPRRGPRVYAAIANVAGELSVTGISKDRKNQQQGYAFRGIDDMYNALSSLMARVGLVILPRVLSRQQIERTNKSGGAIFWSFVEVEYDFVSVEDGSSHTCKAFGEAMDSADKSTNKAMSAAYKYAVMQAFCIPTEGDNDADATTHAVVPQPVRQDVKSQDAKAEPKPEAPKADAATPMVPDLMTADQAADIGAMVKQHGLSKEGVASMIYTLTSRQRKDLTKADADKIAAYLRGLT